MHNTPNRLVIALSGDIDHHKASRLRQEIDSAAEAKRPELLELDFRDVTFMDSSGIGLIMGRYRLVTGWNGHLLITHVPPQIQKLMQLAGLGTLPIFEGSGKEGM
ncbi:MAG: STAS domain-containing protein [Clostridia bacterium]|nr:STAS domain-containing protein [Clostridia bacterium]